MADNYGYIFSYKSDEYPSGRARASKVYRTKLEASKAANSFSKYVKGKNPRVGKATKKEYDTFSFFFRTGRI